MSDDAEWSSVCELLYGFCISALLVVCILIGVFLITVGLRPAGGYPPSIPKPENPGMATLARLNIDASRNVEIWVLGMQPVPSSWRLVKTGGTGRTYRTATGDTVIEVVVVMRDSLGGRWGAGPGAARWVNGVVAAMNERDKK